MVFVYPLFLWALSCLAIPIIIHLFNFRRYKKVYFTNVKFLKELQLESKSRSRLKEILILISRCIAIACLVIAFSQPVIFEKAAPEVPKGVRAISIYIDNSFSMGNVNKQGPLFEIAKTRAKEIVNAFAATDKIQIITNDFEGKHQRFNSKENALSVIEALKVSPSTRLLSEVVKRQHDFLIASGIANKKIYVLSDAQKSTFDLEDVAEDSTTSITILPLVANKVNNIYLDSCWFETPLQQKGFIQKLHGIVVNNGTTDLEAASAKLFLNSQQIALTSFSLAANSRDEVTFTFECKKEGFNFGSIKIEDYPVTFDDELFFAFNSKINLAITLINGKDQSVVNPFSSLFKSDSLYEFNSFMEQAIDYNFFKSSNVIILNQVSELSSGLISELLKFTAQDGAIVINPSLKANFIIYNPLMTALQLPLLESVDSTLIKVDKIEWNSPFYSGVFEKVEDRMNLPLVNKHYKLVKNNRSNFEKILALQNGESLFGFSRLNNSLVYFFAAPLNETATNFTKHALFVPTFYQICFNSVKPGPLFYSVGSNVVINLKNTLPLNEQPPHIIQPERKIDIIPETKVVNNGLFLYTRQQVNDPGYYLVKRGKDTLKPLAFNYSRRESNLDVYSKDDLDQTISGRGLKTFSLLEDTGADISSQVLMGAEGKKLWKLFIILALLFLCIEVALLRILK